MKKMFSILFQIRRLIVHPKFNYDTHFADLALLRLSESAELNRFVNPVCISHAVKKLEGTIPGFDFKANSYFGKDLSSVKVNIIDSRNCTLKHKKVAAVDTTLSSLFCAKYAEPAPCKGDDGTGYYYPVGMKWHIGGIMSIGWHCRRMLRAMRIILLLSRILHPSWIGL